MTSDSLQEWIRVCPLAELQHDGHRVVAAGGRTVLVLESEGAVYAVDNRCPHMGFPLSRGTVNDGILTCHWHHAKFDLAGGCTFDPFADDVTPFRTRVADDAVWLDPVPIEEDQRVRWGRKLSEGLEQNIRLVLAKSVIGLCNAGGSGEVVARTASFGARNRAPGWSPGLTILAAMANVLPELSESDRPLALFHGVAAVASDTSGQAPNFLLEPLETSERDSGRYLDWFRRFVDLRSANAAERVIRTAADLGFEPSVLAGIVGAAATDHLYMAGGHSLDFANKSFELLDHVGWERAGEVLPTLVPDGVLVGAARMEESASWRMPADLAAMLFAVRAKLDRLIDDGARANRRSRPWGGWLQLAEMMLDGDPQSVLDELCRLIGAGVALTDLSATVAYAAARRVIHFGVSNEFSDWETVLHTFTYANAVDQALRRTPSRLLARGIFDGAVSVHLDRFLNVPKQALPVPGAGGASGDELLAAFDAQGHEDAAGQVVADMVAVGRADEAVTVLGHALLREDAGFHSFQMYEAAVRQYRQFADAPFGGHFLIAAARYLSAHSPTVRAFGQTYDIAARLLRGEDLHGEG
jgi:nitrite reductase/ring-hydroxylating ferredoxin subunit